MLHQILERHLKRLGLDAETPPTLAEWQKLLDRTSRAYSEADQDRYLLERSLTISSQEMQDLTRQLREQLADLSVLNEVNQAILEVESEQALLAAIHEQVSRVMETTNFYVALYDQKQQELDFGYFFEEGKLGQDPIRYPVSEGGLTAYIVQNRKALFLPDNFRARLAELGIAGRGQPALSYLGVPMIAGEQTIGAIAVQSYRQEGAYSLRHLALLTNIATQAALAIQRLRLRDSERSLFETMQKTLDELQAAGEQQRRLLDLVREMSTPLVPLFEGVLLLPLVGTIDSQRAQQILDVLLAGIAERRARVVILDITGVPVVDTSVANYLLRATQSARLLGAECVLVGIKPEVAQTVVGLGVDLSQVITRSDLRGGIERALQLIGQRTIITPKQAGAAWSSPA